MRVCTLSLSVVAHVLVLTLVVGIPLFGTSVLPERHRVLEFVHVVPAIVSFSRPVLRSRERSTSDTARSTAAPLEEP